MGICINCGKKTGLLRGKKFLDSYEYCWSCYENILKNEAIEGLKQYKERFNIPENPYIIGYAGGFANVDKFIKENLLEKIVFKKDRMIDGNIFFWIKRNHLMFALSPYVDESGFSNQDILDLIKYIEVLKENGEISELEFLEKRSLFLMKNNHIIISCIQKSEDFQPFFSISKEDVLFFSRVGDFYAKTSGGGFNLTGAIVGGIVGSSVGAIIGSRNKIDTEVIDERNTILMVKEKDDIKGIFFTSSTFDVLSRVIPDKEISVVNISSQQRKMNPFEDDISTKIEKLIELKARGVLTAEEYEERKKRIIDKYIG